MPPLGCPAIRLVGGLFLVAAFSGYILAYSPLLIAGLLRIGVLGVLGVLNFSTPCKVALGAGFKKKHQQ